MPTVCVIANPDRVTVGTWMKSFLHRAVRNRKFPELATASTVANGIAAILTAFERAALRLREIRYL